MQEVALAEVHVTVEEPPEVTETGEADMVTVGGVGAGALTAVQVTVAPPLKPTHCQVAELPTVGKAGLGFGVPVAQ